MPLAQQVHSTPGMMPETGVVSYQPFVAAALLLIWMSYQYFEIARNS
jgi:hypothetical protein